MVIVAAGAGVAYGAYQQSQWGDLGLAGGVMLLGLLVAYVGFRVRLSAEVEKKRLEVMLEELKAAPRRSRASSKEHLGSDSHG